MWEDENGTPPVEEAPTAEEIKVVTDAANAAVAAANTALAQDFTGFTPESVEAYKAAVAAAKTAAEKAATDAAAAKTDAELAAAEKAATDAAAAVKAAEDKLVKKEVEATVKAEEVTAQIRDLAGKNIFAVQGKLVGDADSVSIKELPGITVTLAEDNTFKGGGAIADRIESITLVFTKAGEEVATQVQEVKLP